MNARDIPAIAKESDIEVVHRGKADPQISVLMPLFRQSQYIEEAILSITAQEDVVCEVIVSDDASEDGTAELAASILRRADVGAHRILLRRGHERLRRDHIPVLVRLAETRVVAQAHGDDISHPMRMRHVLDVMKSTRASFFCSGFDTIDASGRIVDTFASSDQVSSPHFVDSLDAPWWAVGAVQAWRPGQLAAFRPLDMRYAPVGHDRILPLRASMTGRLAVSHRSLVRRRQHGENWSESLVDASGPVRRKHGWALHRLLILDVVRDDLDRARDRELVSTDDYSAMKQALEGEMRRTMQNLRRSHGELLRAGELSRWVTEGSY